MSRFGQCNPVPAEGHRVKNRGSAEAWNNLQLGDIPASAASQPRAASAAAWMAARMPW